MELLIIIFFGIFGLSLIVLVHESGHYIAARLCGVGVETFSIGFGKKLIGFTRKGITYQISWFLFGGYCKLKGEMFKPDFTEEDFKKAKEEKGTFLAASLFRKICIVTAGPLANIIFAALIFSVIEFAGYKIEVSSTKIILQSEYPMGDPNPLRVADEAGFKTGDIILAVNGNEVKYFDDVFKIVSKSRGKELLFTLKRGDEVITRKVIPEEKPGDYVARIGIFSWTDPLIESIKKDTPASKAGLKKGDVILSVNGKNVPHTIAFFQELSEQPKSAEITYSRDGETKSAVMDLSSMKKGEINPGINFKRFLIQSPKYDPFTALLKGVGKAGGMFALIFQSFTVLFRVGVKDVSDVVAGPIRITQMMGQQALSGFSISLAEGFTSFFNFICMISVLLGFMNLLPIPLLDGGQAVLAFIMKIIKNTGSKFVMWYQLVGFAIVIMLTFLAVFSDLSFFLR
jgi:regulator of sigma E protease